jgi:hypothetical protein
MFSSSSTVCNGLKSFNVVALLDISAACCTKLRLKTREICYEGGIEVMTVTPLITSILGNYKNPPSGVSLGLCEKEGVYGAFAKSLR